MSILPLLLPSVAPNMAEGKLANWLVKTGEAVERGEPLLEVETDKATVEVESPVTGILRRRLAKAGTTLPVGALIGIVAPAEIGEADINLFIQGYGR